MYNSHPLNALSRWVIGVWLIYCIILSSSYAGNLEAFMMTPSLTSPINTLREVYQNTIRY